MSQGCFSCKMSCTDYIFQRLGTAEISRGSEWFVLQINCYLIM